MSGGFWEPHSSSVDFCETNYLLSNHVAEFHNTWSSLLITAIACLGFFNSNPLQETRFSMMFAILGLVGIGSTFLHGTLHWLPQSSDEVPMLWQSLSFTYALLVMKDPPGSSRPKWIGLGFIFLAVLQTFLYYRYQQTYTIFIASFLAYCVINSLWTAFHAFAPDPSVSGTQRVSLWCTSFFSLAILGGGAWILDYHGCHFLRPYYDSLPFFLKGITFHVLWHIASSLGVYMATVFLIVVRMETLNIQPEIKWFAKAIPICHCRKKKGH